MQLARRRKQSSLQRRYYKTSSRSSKKRKASRAGPQNRVVVSRFGGPLYATVANTFNLTNNVAECCQGIVACELLSPCPIAPPPPPGPAPTLPYAWPDRCKLVYHFTAVHAHQHTLLSCRGHMLSAFRRLERLRIVRGQLAACNGSLAGVLQVGGSGKRSSAQRTCILYMT